MGNATADKAQLSLNPPGEYFTGAGKVGNLMRILRIKLENFQGIARMEFDLGGRDANIYGDNATGKTTVFNAFTWLLFGKASAGAENFTPKTRTADGEAHNLEHSAECDMEIYGAPVTFRKVYREIYKKTRGGSDEVISGHTTDYFINGVPKKEKEYLCYWQDIFKDEETPKLLSIPSYFAETLHWEKRRHILLDICGTLSDTAIMDSDEELKALPPLIRNLRVDEFKKIAKASLADINRNIQSIPGRIDEARRAIPDTSGYTASDVDERLNAVRQFIAGAEKERADLIAGGDSAAAARARIAKLNADLAEARRDYSEKRQSASAETHSNVRELRQKLSGAEGRAADARRRKLMMMAQVEIIEKKRADIIAEHRKLRDEHAKTGSRVFDESAAFCNCCGQPLPPDKTDELRDGFNLKKSRKLEELARQMNELVKRGESEASKEILASAQKTVADADSDIAAEQTEVDRLSALLTRAEQKLKQEGLPPFESTDEYRIISGKIASAKADEANSAPDTTAIDEKISSYRAEEKNLVSAKANLAAEAAQKARIAELEQREHELGKAYEESQRNLYLCEKFSRVKSASVTDGINGLFQTVRFNLFRKNITNNGIEDICDVMIPSGDGSLVPFSIANNAARINAGIEIIGVLSKHCGVQLPVWVDNAESITRVIPVNGQLIRLIVSEIDKQLRLELL